MEKKKYLIIRTIKEIYYVEADSKEHAREVFDVEPPPEVILINTKVKRIKKLTH